MKEKDEDSYSEDCVTNQLDVTSNNVDKFRQILDSKEQVTININHPFQLYININIISYLKIIQMLELYPEERILFLVNEKKFYSQKSMIKFSESDNNSSNLSDKEENSSFNTIKLKNMKKKKLKEEIINTDIIKPKTFNSPFNINFITVGNEENIDNIQIENEIMINNIKNMQLFSHNPNGNKITNTKIPKKIKTSADKKLVLFKWLYHFYIILSIIIFFHLFTLIFSKYDYAKYYKVFSLLLIASLAVVGYVGIKYKYTKPPIFIFNGRYLFWVHFFILVLTILNFTSLLLAGGQLKLIKTQGFLGYFMSFIYLISLFIESIYTLYYDVIIEEINWDRNNHNTNKINDYINNQLNIQLTEIE